MTPITRVRRYGVIEKMIEQEDGTLKVFGYASTEEKDDQGETVTADAMKGAIPGYMKWGAVREMHQPTVAAGTALNAAVDEQGRTEFGVHVVDAAACQKVRTGVYKGFSIGAKVLGRDPTDKTRITKIDLIEVSLVDRPANPGAVMVITKRADADAPDTEEAPVTETIKKGTYSVTQFCDLLNQLSWLAQDSANEAFWEGDASPVPAKLKAWIAAGAQILMDMTAEEVAELVASMGVLPSTIAAAARITTAKAAADALTAQVAELTEKAAALEAEKSDLLTKAASVTVNVTEVAEVTQKLTAASDMITKVSGERDAAVVKVTELEGHIEKIGGEIKTMIETLRAKGVLLTVEKASDGGTPSEPVIEKAIEKPEDVSDMIKKAHASGGTVITGRRPAALAAS